MSKFIISGFYDEVSSDLKTQLELIKSLGGKYLCPRSINGKNISTFNVDSFKSEVLPLLNEYGVKISTMGSPYGKVKINDDVAFEAQLANLKNTVEICKEIGCKYIRVFSFFPPAGDDFNKYHDLVVEKMKKFLETVEGTDIMLLHENEKKIYGDNPNRCVRLYEAIANPKNFGLIYDASNYIQCDYDPVDAYFLTRDYITEFHIKDCYKETKVEVPLGLGQGSYDAILADADKHGFEGFVTLEPHTWKYSLLKRTFYIAPFWLIMMNFIKTFRYIDKQLNVSLFGKISRKDIFVIQHTNLVELLDKLKKS